MQSKGEGEQLTWQVLEKQPEWNCAQIPRRSSSRPRRSSPARSAGVQRAGAPRACGTGNGGAGRCCHLRVAVASGVTEWGLRTPTAGMGGTPGMGAPGAAGFGGPRVGTVFPAPRPVLAAIRRLHEEIPLPFSCAQPPAQPRLPTAAAGSCPESCAGRSRSGSAGVGPSARPEAAPAARGNPDPSPNHAAVLRARARARARYPVDQGRGGTSRDPQRTLTGHEPDLWSYLSASSSVQRSKLWSHCIPGRTSVHGTGRARLCRN